MKKVFGMCVVLVGLATILSSCGGVRNYQITSTPIGADVVINREPAGKTPLDYPFNFRQYRTFHVKCVMDGYFPMEYNISPRNFGYIVRGGVLRAEMKKNPAWEETTESKATNVWLRVQVTDKLDEKTVWQKIVDSVTTVYDSLEQLDRESGYIRSNWRVKKYMAPGGKHFVIKTQFIGSIASRNPMVYKFKILSYKVDYNSTEGTPYSRVFKKDAQLVQELDGRLSVK